MASASDESLVRALLNATIANFQICGERLGKRTSNAEMTHTNFDGCTAVVFPSQSNLTDDHRFALKMVFNFYNATYSRIRLHFKAELSALQYLRRFPHPNIVRTYA